MFAAIRRALVFAEQLGCGLLVETDEPRRVPKQIVNPNS